MKITVINNQKPIEREGKEGERARGSEGEGKGRRRRRRGKYNRKNG